MKTQSKRVSVTPKVSVLVRSVDFGQVDTLLFCGIGQKDKSVKRIASQIPPNVGVVESLPYLDGPNGVAAMTEFAILCISSILKEFPGITDILAESQSAPAICEVLAISQTTPRLTLISPLGFNKQFLGTTDESRTKELLRRSRLFWSHRNQSLLIPGNSETFSSLLKDGMFRGSRLKSGMHIGANQDSMPALDRVCKKTSVTVYAGEADSLFPYREIAQTLASTNVTVIELKDITHLNRATPKGIDQLNYILAQS